MFVMPIHDPAKPLAQCIDEDLELAVQCEELGFHDFWVGEHHSSSVENIVMPEIFLAKVLGVTNRVRIGPAPVCLQYHHPAHVAGRLAFLSGRIAKKLYATASSPLEGSIAAGS